MNAIGAVIIDLDDTLCLTEEVAFAMENESLSLLGLAPMARTIHQETWGQPIFKIIATRSPGVDIAAFKAVFATVIAKYVSDGKLDAISLANFHALDTLVSEGRQLFVLTSRTHAELKHLLQPDHELSGRVTAFYYRDNMEFHKPDPRAFGLLVREHGLTPTTCVYVGDSPSDAAAANGAGLHFVASLESGLRTRDDFSPYTVDAFINHFAELPKAIGLLER